MPAPKIIYLLDELNFLRQFRWNFVYQLPPYYRPTHRSTLAMQTTCDIGAKMRHTHTHIHKLHTLPAYQKCKKCVRVCYFSFFHHHHHRLVQLLVNLAKVSNAHMTFRLTGYATRPHCAAPALAWPGPGVRCHQTQTF